MKLRRIEAVSFGALKDCSLGDLGDGLSVVLGPNESGKSTYTALVRQVLYGFPDRRSKDFGYEPAAGTRAGTLVFGNDEGEWAITRTDGTKGGAVRVDPLKGPQRDGLLPEIVGSVAEQTFRVVFGFGLDELDDIASGTDKQVMDRLYAGASGLEVNPIDVRRALEQSKGDLFKPGGRNARLSVLSARIREQRAALRELETAARDFAAEQRRLKELGERLVPVREAKEASDKRLRALERDLQNVESMAATAAEERERLEAARTALAEHRRDAERTVVDDRILALSAEIEALLADASAAKGQSERARTLEMRAAELERSAATHDAPPIARDTPQARAALEGWRATKARLEADAEATQRAASSSRSKAEALTRAGQGEASLKREGGSPVFAWVVLALGLAGVAAGLALGQTVAAVVGMAAIIVGAAMLLLGRRQSAGAPDSLSAEALRQRSDAEAAEAVAAESATRLGEKAAEWAAWLVESGLDARGVETAAVAALLDDAHKRDELLAQAASLRAEADAEREAAVSWAERLTSLVRGPLGISETSPEPQALAIRAGEALSAAKAARDKRSASLAAIEAVEGDIERSESALERLTQGMAEIGAAYGITEHLTAGLAAARDEAAVELTRIAQEFEALLKEHTALETKLGSQGRDASMALVRQDLEGLNAEAAEAADRYLVEAMAVKLVDLARERYERDRQPQVVRVASEVFSAITKGRYTDVRVPFGESRITVVTDSGKVRAIPELSRGTAEQLYLALRVGLIESFGEQGPHLPVLMDDIVVNYDYERIQEAATAIAALSASRQVVFFTCHEATADALTNGVPGATRIELNRCSL